VSNRTDGHSVGSLREKERWGKEEGKRADRDGYSSLALSIGTSEGEKKVTSGTALVLYHVLGGCRDCQEELGGEMEERDIKERNRLRLAQ